MSVQNITRRAGPFTGTGQVSDFPFGFKVFINSDVSVRRSSSADASSSEVVLKLDEDYTVKLNANQDENPGGIVTLMSALPTGYRLAIISAIVPDQQVVLTNHGGFYPETLNTVHDKAIALIQELKEESERTLKVSATTEKTPEQTMTEILDVATHAQESSQLAAETLRQTQELAQTVETRVVETGNTVKAEIVAVGNQQKEVVVAEGDFQVERVAAAADSTLWQTGLGCQECTWSVAENIPAGTSIKIPNGMQYVVGRHHLRLSWNGLSLFPEENFSEIGTADQKSSQFNVLFDLTPGDVLDAWTPALGSGLAADALAEAQSASDAVAELSRKVVYKDEESAS